MGVFRQPWRQPARRRPVPYSVAAAAPTTVAVTDANWIWSPYNWNFTGGTAIAVNGGAYFRLKFSGTSVSIGIDMTSINALGLSAALYPRLRYWVDAGVQTDLLLASSTTALTISGLSAGNHTIEVWYRAGDWESTPPERWTSPNYAIKITGATLATSGDASVAGTSRSKRLLWFGDSISEGIRANYATTQSDCQDSCNATPVYVADALDAELGNCSFGGQGYSTGYGNIPNVSSAYAYIYSGVARSFTTEPDYVALWHGANGTATNCQTTITNIRSACPNARIFVIIPAGGINRSGITTAFGAYQSANPSDAKVHLIDLGTAWDLGLGSIGSATVAGIDGLHPRANWHARLAARTANLMKAAIDGIAAPTATKTATVTLVNESGTAQTGLSALKWAWFDQVTPNLFAAPTDQGAIETTDGSGVLSITVHTDLAAAGVGWLVVTNSDGTVSATHRSFAGPVAVS